MSFWYHKKEKDGKRSLIAADIPVELIVFMIGLLAALLIPRYARNQAQIAIDRFYIIAAGFILLLISKSSLFTKGIWNSWGPAKMSKPFKLIYVFGYIIIGIGVFGILLFLGKAEI